MSDFEDYDETEQEFEGDFGEDEDYDETEEFEEGFEKAVTRLPRRREKLNAIEFSLRNLQDELINFGVDTNDALNITKDLVDFESVLYMNKRTLAASIVIRDQAPVITDINKVTKQDFDRRFDDIKDKLLTTKSDVNRAKTTVLKYIKMYNNYLIEE